MSYAYQPDGPLSHVYYKTSGGVVTARTTSQTSGAASYDYFPDTGVAVGDSMIFGNKDGWSSGTYANIAYGKYHGIKFDVSTALVATAITGVWEYASTPSVAGTVVWTALSNVRDDTNAFQNTGANTVTWDVPTDWSNRNVPSDTTDYYMWYVRFRITAVTNLTEGGRQSATTTKIISHSISVVAQAGTTFTSIYNADKAGTLTLDTRSVTATDAGAITLKNFLAPADYYVLGGASNNLYIIVTAYTGAGSVTVRITGTDSAGIAQTEDITFTANGTYYATKYFKTLTGSHVTAFTATSVTYAVTQNQWGVCYKHGDGQFAFDATITITGASDFSTSDEQVLFMNGNRFHNKGTGTIAYGLLYAEDKVYGGTDFMYEGTSNDYNACHIAPNGTATFYNLRVKNVTTGAGLACQGHWGSNIGSSTGHTIYGLFVDKWRQLDFRSSFNSIIGATIYGGQTEQTAAGNMVGVTTFGSAVGIRVINTESAGNNRYVHKYDLAQSTTGGVQIYQEQDIDQFNFYVVDSKWGLLKEGSVAPWKVYWLISGTVTYTTQQVYEVYSLEQKLMDRFGNVVSNALVNIYDSTGANVLSCLTSPDGYLNIDYGTVTSATSTTLVDTTKSWTTTGYGQHAYKEVLITSGTGMGQRRYVMASNNSATLLKITPAWVTTPDATSKYVILPYISVKKFTPHVFTPSATTYSDVTNLGPHRLVIQKSGFNMIDDKITISQPLTGVIPMTRSTLDLTN